MIFSLTRLKKLANLQTIADEKIFQAINDLGFEVESTKKLNQVSGIKFGKVLQVYPNPDADNLQVCKIIFNDKERIIQTRAKNVVAGKYIMAFVPGSKSGDITFAAKKMQNIVSEGMLVSLNELGFDENLIPHELQGGIFVFDEEVDLNSDPLDIFELDDYLVDIKILTNRSDANSYLIMANELAAYFGQKYSLPDFKTSGFISDVKFLDNNYGKLSGVEAKVVDNLKINDLLLILKSGIKIFYSPVDLTNFVLLYSGQPCHVYNKSDIQGMLKLELVNQKANIFGNKAVDVISALAVRDDHKTLSFAGIIGIEELKVTTNKDLVFEIANFDSSLIRQSMKELKIQNQSANQSSKNLSQGSQLLAHIVLNNYIKEISQPINFEYLHQEKLINFSKTKLEEFIGHKLDEKRYQQSITNMQILGFVYKNEAFIPPFYRYDVNIFEDLVEEFMRFYGYNNITSYLQAQKPFIVNKNDFISQLKSQIVALGFAEINTFTLTDKNSNEFNPFDLQTTQLATFLSQDLIQIRHSLAISASAALIYNQKRKISSLSFFEIAMISEEQQSLVLASTEFDFFDIKNILLNIFNLEFKFLRAQKYLHPGKSALIYIDKQLVGWIGQPHPQFKFAEATYCEINLTIIEKLLNYSFKFNNYNNQSLVIRDVTISLQEKQSIEYFVEEVKKIPGFFAINIKDSAIINSQQKVTFKITFESTFLEVWNNFLQKFN
ncbi:Phenylalanine--tRNA ligase beta subunit [Mesomycoplasma conjunctivae]|uniref:Phenylalanine--tRNA ligase beta subunit n=1 Tax=Mesomycoplasma conjunctivae (strain ATCC 25834 / NCTC 10147 / HRC/581) TaxID=572263 RepID=C5J6V6_MESCH|nr:phenylalanine--tRNA ligase subunit beta [Mesomycoplasma conjunctivae]CAT05219.1 Phenylalanyl-tRNA synthetase beta chain [Mesomycoplasma conjunctivae]VEU66437.1 Phenylalanine--tRNA ligase beta subunit [Mesomycoplasma conjunctivae]